MKKTLKELCAAGYYAAADIPKAWHKATFYKDVAELEYKEEEFLADVRTVPGFEMGVFWACCVQTDGLHYIDRYPFIFVKEHGSFIVMRLVKDYRNKNKSVFYQANWQTQNIRSNNFSYKEPEPNAIGVFTGTKLNAWNDYLTAKFIAMRAYCADVERINKGIKSRIKNFIDALPKSRVVKNGDTTYVDTGYFKIEFRHHVEMAHLITKVDYQGTIEDIPHMEKKIRR